MKVLVGTKVATKHEGNNRIRKLRSMRRRQSSRSLPPSFIAVQSAYPADLLLRMTAAFRRLRRLGFSGFCIEFSTKLKV